MAGADADVVEVLQHDDAIGAGVRTRPAPTGSARSPAAAEPQTRMFARAPGSPRRTSAIARDSAPARTKSSSELSARRRLRTMSTKPAEAGGAIPSIVGAARELPLEHELPGRHGSPLWAASRAIVRPSASSLVKDASASVSVPARRARTWSWRTQLNLGDVVVLEQRPDRAERDELAQCVADEDVQVRALRRLPFFPHDLGLIAHRPLDRAA